MSKKRINKIKSKVRSTPDSFPYLNITSQDFHWLIEQAQELEKLKAQNASPLSQLSNSLKTLREAEEALCRK